MFTNNWTGLRNLLWFHFLYFHKSSDLSCTCTWMHASFWLSLHTAVVLGTRVKCISILCLSQCAILWYNLAYPSGVLCAFVESLCSPNPCGSNGSCVENNSGFKCVCDVSHTGRLCQTGQSARWHFVIFCKDVLNQHGATCTMYVYSFARS